MLLLKDLLMNLLIILIVILLFNMILWNKRFIISKKYFQLLLFLFASILIVANHFLAYEIDGDFTLDLRYIPFLIGALYGGKRVAISLGIVLITARIFFGGLGITTASISLIISLIILYKFFPILPKKSVKWRVTFTTFLSFVYASITYLLPAIIYDFYHFYDMCIYFFILISSTLFVVYLTEIFRTVYIYEQEIIRTEKLKLISHLAASISHEVKNPLTTVKGFLQLIKEEQGLSNEGRQYVELAHDEVIRATEIINDYLTFAKPNSGKKEELDIKESIIKCTEIIKPLANAANVIIETNFSHLHKIHGDANKLIQILLNICKNSIEAMPNGGKLHILTRDLDDFIQIKIIDTGHGIKNEHLAKLGEPYFSTKKQDGTGLGLMVVFQLVKAMNGRLKIDSTIHLGTTVTIIFPSIKN